MCILVVLWSGSAASLSRPREAWKPGRSAVDRPADIKDGHGWSPSDPLPVLFPPCRSSSQLILLGTTLVPPIPLLIPS